MIGIQGLRQGIAGNLRQQTFQGVSTAEALAILLLLVVGTALYLAGGYRAVALIVPPGIFIVMAFANWAMIKADGNSLWTPLFSFRLASSIFLGFGGILSENVSVSAQQVYLAELTYSPQEAAYVFLIWLTGILAVLAGFYLAARFQPTRSDEPGFIGASDKRTLLLGSLFIFAGLGYNYFVRLPIELGILPLGTIPGSVSTPFDAALAVGVFLLSLWSLRQGGLALLLIPAVLVAGCSIGLLLLTKQGVLLPLVFFGLAVLFERITVMRLVAITGLLVLSFALLQPMIAYARAMVIVDLPLDPGERLGHLSDYIAEGDALAEQGDIETDFLRFGHTHVAAFIVDRYDRGMPSLELRNSLIALVPRIVWPDKPILTQGASDLYFLVSGREGSALATTTFADLYWNAGWIGVILAGLIWGALMWIGTWKSLKIVKRRDWLMMPFVLMVFMIGLAAESAFTVGVFIPTIMAFIAYFLLRWVRMLTVPGVASQADFDRGSVASGARGSTPYKGD